LRLFYRCTGTDGTLLKFNTQTFTVYSLFVAIPGKALNADGGDVSAEAPKALQKSHLNATPCRRNGCRQASRP
jgi:hypothetical protein